MKNNKNGRKKSIIAVFVCLVMVFTNFGYVFAEDTETQETIPQAPVAELVTSDTVELVAVEGYEYSMGGLEWQSSTIFTGLKPYTTYTFYQRVAATDTSEAGEVSTPVAVRTKKMPVEAPEMPSIKAVKDVEIELVYTKGFEYSKDGTTWQKSVLFGGLEPDTEYVFYQRVAETSSNEASPASQGLMIRTKKSGAVTEAPVIVDCTVTSIEVKVVKGAEYSIDGENWQENGLFDNLEPLTTYTVYQRLKETGTQVAGEISTLTVMTPKAESVPEGYVGIYSVEDLDNVRNNLAGNYIMMNDISFSEVDFQEGGAYYNEGKAWIPLGTKDEFFTGRFNGNGHTIQNLKISGTDINTAYFGLFGCSTGNIRNLGVTDVKISIEQISSESVPGAQTGVIAGVSNGIISNCYATGFIDMYADGYYISFFRAGGIAGYNGGTIEQSYSTVTIAASRGNGGDIDMGGIAGAGGTIVNCYNAGRLISKSTVYTSLSNIAPASTVSDCYAIDQQADEDFKVEFLQASTVLTQSQMTDESAYVGFDFDNTWIINSENGYPYPQLKNVAHKKADENNVEFAGGTGSSYDPYIIKDATHLANVENYLGASYIMEADIVFSKKDFEAETWQPLGHSSKNGFYGHFDGNGHVIKNIKVKEESNKALTIGGVFKTNAGIIENVGTVGGKIDVIVLPDVAGYSESFYAGGLVGSNKGIIRNCYNDSDINAVEQEVPDHSVHINAGGLVGNGASGLVKNCYNSGNVYTEAKGSSFLNTGGIIGEYGNMYNCYNSGQTIQIDNSTADASGLIGTTNGTVENCYSSYNKKKNIYDSDEWYLTDDEMLSAESYIGFDFDTVWNIDVDGEYPYPTLRKVPYVTRDDNNEGFAGGSGSRHQPFIIKTSEHLKNIEQYQYGYFELGADIDLSNELWAGIFADEEKPFLGVLDGKGYSIVGMNCESVDSDELCVGLFGFTNGTIKNLNFDDYKTNIENKGNGLVKAGVIAGHVGYGGVIENCDIRNGSIRITNKTSSVYFGGIAGYLDDGNINSVSFHGDIDCVLNNTRTIYVGGIVGYNAGKLAQSYNSSGIHASFEDVTNQSVSHYFGGVSAANYGEIRDCYNVGTISMDRENSSFNRLNVGGIAATTVDKTNKNKTPIINVYNAGTVQGNPIVFKGYITAVNNAYYTDKDNSDYVYGTLIDESNTYEGFDFQTIWYMANEDEGHSKYPQLRAFRSKIPETGHKEIIDLYKDATCTETGLTEGKHCPVCDWSIEQQIIPAKGHDIIIHEAKSAACTESGWEEYETCSRCDYTTYKEIAAQGHIYSEWITDVAATCNKEGYKYRECACGDKIVETIPALGHDIIAYEAKSATCTENGWEPYEACSRCDYTTYKEIAAQGHIWSSKYTVDKTATINRAGSKSKRCTVCDIVKEDSVVGIARIKKTTATTLVYNGKNRTQNISVVNVNGKKLVKGQDFTVTYKNAKGTKVVTPKVVGTYKAVVSFKGSYSGKVTKTFKINPEGTAIKKLTKPAKKQIRIAWKKQSVQTTGYQIRYSTKANMNSSKTVLVKNSKTTARTIKNLKSNKKYWVQIRTYKAVNNQKHFSAWSEKKTIITK